MTAKPNGSHGSTVVDVLASGHLPSSGMLLKVLVDTYELRHKSEYLQESTTRRWFKGTSIKPGSQARVIGEVARSMRALLGDSTMMGSEELLTSAVASWDGLQGAASSVSSVLESSGGPLTIPVLIIRGFAMAIICDCLSVAEDHRPPARVEGIRALLHAWQAAGSKLTRNELARLLGCSRNTVDSWLDGGKLPQPPNVVELARVFGDHLRRCERELAIELRQRIARARLARWLLEAIRNRVARAGSRRLFVVGSR